MGKLYIQLQTKIEAFILSTLSYGLETRAGYVTQIRSLQSYHSSCLGRIMTIKWWDKSTNVEILERVNVESVRFILKRNVFVGVFV